jgi:hypothetical protein
MASPFGDPNMMALLGLSSGLLQAGSPSLMPISTGGALAQGMQGALSNYALGTKLNQQNTLIDLEKQKVALTKAQVEALAQKARIASQIGGAIKQWESGPMQASPMMGVSDSSAASIGAPWAAASSLPQQAPSRPPFPFSLADVARFKAGADIDLLPIYKEANPDLEFKDGIWYSKKTGAPVRGGAGVNQQGFGYQTNVGPGGQISLGMLPGAGGVYAEQQRIGEAARAAHDLVVIPPTAPNKPPTYASRQSLLPGAASSPSAPGVGRPSAAPAPAAGMSPQAASGQAADAAQQTEIAKNYGKLYNELQNSSMANPNKIAKFQRIGALLGDFEGGKLSKTGFDMARLANSAGLKLDPRLSNKEAAEALSNEVALELRSTGEGGGMPGAMSDPDREFLKGMTPQMAQTADGRKKIIESRVKVMERENQVAGMARQYKKKYGKLDEDFFAQLSEWSSRNPLFSK